MVRLLVLLFLVAGCSQPKTEQPILSWIYKKEIQQVRKRPVIVIPGALGSGLRDTSTNEELWFTGDSYFNPGKLSQLALPISSLNPSENRDSISSFQMIERLNFGPFQKDVYWNILQTLGTAGFRDAALEFAEPTPDHNCYVFHYDWRRDLSESAAELGRTIQKVQKILGNSELKVNILAHSMGGLVARYYLMYGDEEIPKDGSLPPVTWAGAKNVNNLIMLGTPNGGSATSLDVLHRGLRSGDRQLVNEIAVATMPAIYQVLPQSKPELFYDWDLNPVKIDLYDVDSWKKLKLGIFQDQTRKILGNNFPRYEQIFESYLKNSQTFWKMLEQPATSTPATNYYAFGGDCQGTPAGVILEGDIGSHRLWFTTPPSRFDTVAVNDVLYAPGDLRVTRNSLLRASKLSRIPGHPNVASAFNCIPHNALTEHPVLQNNILHVLFNDPLTEEVEFNPEYL